MKAVLFYTAFILLVASVCESSYDRDFAIRANLNGEVPTKLYSSIAKKYKLNEVQDGEPQPAPESRKENTQAAQPSSTEETASAEKRSRESREVKRYDSVGKRSGIHLYYEYNWVAVDHPTSETGPVSAVYWNGADSYVAAATYGGLWYSNYYYGPERVENLYSWSESRGMFTTALFSSIAGNGYNIIAGTGNIYKSRLPGDGLYLSTSGGQYFWNLPSTNNENFAFVNKLAFQNAYDGSRVFVAALSGLWRSDFNYNEYYGYDEFVFTRIIDDAIPEVMDTKRDPLLQTVLVNSNFGFTDVVVATGAIWAWKMFDGLYYSADGDTFTNILGVGDFPSQLAMGRGSVAGGSTYAYVSVAAIDGSFVGIWQIESNGEGGWTKTALPNTQDLFVDASLVYCAPPPQTGEPGKRDEPLPAMGNVANVIAVIAEAEPRWIIVGSQNLWLSRDGGDNWVPLTQFKSPGYGNYLRGNINHILVTVTPSDSYETKRELAYSVPFEIVVSTDNGVFEYTFSSAAANLNEYCYFNPEIPSPIENLSYGLETFDVRGTVGNVGSIGPLVTIYSTGAATYTNDSFDDLHYGYYGYYGRSVERHVVYNNADCYYDGPYKKDLGQGGNSCYQGDWSVYWYNLRGSLAYAATNTRSPKMVYATTTTGGFLVTNTADGSYRQYASSDIWSGCNSPSNITFIATVPNQPNVVILYNSVEGLAIGYGCGTYFSFDSYGLPPVINMLSGLLAFLEGYTSPPQTTEPPQTTSEPSKRSNLELLLGVDLTEGFITTMHVDAHGETIYFGSSIGLILTYNMLLQQWSPIPYILPLDDINNFDLVRLSEIAGLVVDFDEEYGINEPFPDQDKRSVQDVLVVGLARLLRRFASRTITSIESTIRGEIIVGVSNFNGAHLYKLASPDIPNLVNTLATAFGGRILRPPINPSKRWHAETSEVIILVRILDLITRVWTDISGNFPDLPVTALATSKTNADIFWVGSDLGVWVTYDGGATYNPIGFGMPVVPINQLVFQSSTNLLYAFTKGRGVWFSTASGKEPVMDEIDVIYEMLNEIIDGIYDIEDDLDYIEDDIDSMQDSLDYIEDDLDSIQEYVEYIENDLDDVKDSLDYLEDDLDYIIDTLEDIDIQGVADYLAEQIETTRTSLSEEIGFLGIDLQELFGNAANLLAQQIGLLGSSLGEQLGIVSGNLASQIGNVGGSIQSQLGTVGGNIQSQIGSVGGNIQSQIGTVGGNIQTQIGTVGSGLSEQIGLLGSSLMEQFGNAASTLSTQIGTVETTLSTKVECVKNEIGDLDNKVECVKNEIGDLESQLTEVGGQIVTSIETVGTSVETVQTTINNFGVAFNERMDNTDEAIAEIQLDVDVLSGTVEKLLDTMEQGFDSIVEATDEKNSCIIVTPQQ